MRSDRGKESSEKGGTALPLAEDFYTIQGEGYQTGTAAYFIRLAGCDVGCPWCDAKYTWNIRRYPVSAVEKVIGRAAASGAPCAVITGGEPLMHPLVPLTEGLKANGLQVFLCKGNSTGYASPRNGRPLRWRRSSKQPMNSR